MLVEKAVGPLQLGGETQGPEVPSQGDNAKSGPIERILVTGSKEYSAEQ
jgi:hypothetical protein